MKDRSLYVPAVVSVAIAAILVLIGVVRVSSYSRATSLGALVADSPFWFLGYQRTSYVSAQFFKVLATPAAVGMQYFLFRFLNRGHLKSPNLEMARWRIVDFSSAWVRLILTTLATLHWIVIELAKFSNPEYFFPYSPLEDRVVNLVALLVGQAIAFFGMKHLSFEPIYRRTTDTAGP